MEQGLHLAGIGLTLRVQQIPGQPAPGVEAGGLIRCPLSREAGELMFLGQGAGGAPTASAVRCVKAAMAPVVTVTRLTATDLPDSKPPGLPLAD